MAQKRLNHHKETNECPTHEDPVLCMNSCGFFGSSATMNLCSKCYKDLTLQHARGSSAKAAAAEKVSVTPKSLAAVESFNLGQASSTGLVEPGQLLNRCFSCKKRVGLPGIKCRCGNTYCSLHRYSDKHDCSYDYKSAGSDAIARANTVVKAEKVRKNF